jgi:hypothetical protein
MGQIAAGIVILAGALALALPAKNAEGFFATPAGLVGCILLIGGAALYVVEAARAGKSGRT